MAKAPEGPCHICGKYGKLSFEHSPPEAAFNDRPLVYAAIKKLIGASDLDNQKDESSNAEPELIRFAGGATI